MAERLTKIRCNGIVSNKREETGISCSSYCDSCSQGGGNCKYVSEMIKKLAEYEAAEEEGRLAILPKCNIGDTVYLPIDFQNKIYTGTVEGFEYAKMRNKWVVKIRADDEGICYEAFDNFGKTFFLDVEDAAKMLKEMKKNERILH